MSSSAKNRIEKLYNHLIGGGQQVSNSRVQEKKPVLCTWTDGTDGLFIPVDDRIDIIDRTDELFTPVDEFYAEIIKKCPQKVI